MRISRAISAALLVLGLPAAVPARADSNTTAFTLDAHDARAFAMGGSLLLLPKDDTAIRWNPALLVFCDRPGATASFSQPAADLSATHSSVSAALPVGRVIADSDPSLPVRRTAAGALLMNTGFDLSEGDRWSETQLGGAFAYAFNPYVMVGGVARYRSNSTPVAEAAARGFGVDLGLAVMLTPKVELGMAIRNAMGSVSWRNIGVSESPTTLADLSIALDGKRLKGEAGFEISSAEIMRTIVGGEYGLFGGTLLLRGGSRIFFESSPRIVPTAGIGIRTGSVRLDAGVSMDQSTGLGTTSAASLGYRF